MITDEVIESFLKCRLKSYLKSKGLFGNKTEHDILEWRLLKFYKERFYNSIRAKFSENQISEKYEFDKKIQITF